MYGKIACYIGVLAWWIIIGWDWHVVNCNWIIEDFEDQTSLAIT